MFTDNGIQVEGSHREQWTGNRVCERIAERNEQVMQFPVQCVKCQRHTVLDIALVNSIDTGRSRQQQPIVRHACGW
jgi:hypothetical protein